MANTYCCYSFTDVEIVADQIHVCFFADRAFISHRNVHASRKYVSRVPRHLHSTKMNNSTSNISVKRHFFRKLLAEHTNTHVLSQPIALRANKNGR